MPTLLFASALAASALASSHRSADPSDVIARLAPPDSVLLVRLESARGVLDLAGAFAAIEDPDAPAPAAADLLGEGLMLPGDHARVALDRPLAIAVRLATLEEAPVPEVVFVVPVDDAAAYVASLEPGWTSARGDGYVALSQASTYTASSAPCSLASKLAPGLVSVSIDLERVIAAYRPMIDQGLQMAEMMLPQLAQAQGAAIDMTGMLETYLDVARDIVDSGEGLGFALRREGSELGLSGSFVAREGSALADFGSAQPLDLLAFPGALDGAAPLAIVMGGDWASLNERMSPLIQDALDGYPEPLASQFRTYVAGLTSVYPLIGPVVSMSGGIAPDGLRVRYSVRSEKPQELVESLRSAFAPLGKSTTGVRVEELSPLALEGVSAPRMRVTIDAEALESLTGTHELGHAEREQLRTALAAIYGANGLTLTFLPTADGVTLIAGGDEAYVRSSIEDSKRARSAQEMAPVMRRALAAASGGNPALVYQVDFGRFVQQMADTFGAALGPAAGDLSALPDESLPVTWWGAVRGRSWESGVLADLDRITAFVRDAERASAPRAEDE